MRLFTVLLIAVLLMFAAGCYDNNNEQFNRYSDSMFDTFDTLIQFVAYAESEEEFREYFEHAHERLRELHRLFDVYHDYDGVNNIKTINDQAGIAPVEVEQEVIDLIFFAREWSEKTGGKVNIALGPVLEIWHYYREEALFDPSSAELPPMDRLQQAAEYTDIEKVIVDDDQNTVFLPVPEMSLDVGAVAKGYAMKLVARELIDIGLESAIISAGGNIKTIGQPKEADRDRWGVGIQDPDETVVSSGRDNLLDVIYIAEGSVDTSGDYQRYYRVNGEMYHHLIDPDTLMPANHYRAVTVVATESAPADFMSSALFLLPFDESLALAESLDQFEALWVMPDSEIKMTDGMPDLLQSYGATRAE
ncbi:MAG: FAD:protein FMN transferase [Bacillota bacterium]